MLHCQKHCKAFSMKTFFFISQIKLKNQSKSLFASQFIYCMICKKVSDCDCIWAIPNNGIGFKYNPIGALGLTHFQKWGEGGTILMIIRNWWWHFRVHETPFQCWVDISNCQMGPSSLVSRLIPRQVDSPKI